MPVPIKTSFPSKVVLSRQYTLSSPASAIVGELFVIVTSSVVTSYSCMVHLNTLALLPISTTSVSYLFLSINFADPVTTDQVPTP